MLVPRVLRSHGGCLSVAPVMAAQDAHGEVPRDVVALLCALQSAAREHRIREKDDELFIKPGKPFGTTVAVRVRAMR
jgi:hypothetical protein